MRRLEEECRTVTREKERCEAERTQQEQALVVMRQRLRVTEDRLEMALHTIEQNEARLELHDASTATTVS